MSPAVLAGEEAGKPATAPLPLRRDALPVALAKHALTPQFHWNLNHNALLWLTDEERRTLYALFRFYDSSFEGDSLPAIHCDRFLQLLRDARLLSSHDGEELQVATVEKIFAQAVLGKLRAYLDAEEQPALTFQLFSGALLNCAVHKFQAETSPEAAFKRLVHALLTAKPDSTETRASQGLVQHAELAASPSWSVEAAHGHYSAADTRDPATSNFLQHHVFQQVLTSLSHDPLADERLRERLRTLYDVPEDVASHFNTETITLVTERFRTFDVFDRGVLPRDEVFALLSGVAKKLDIVDVYEVLAVILAGDISVDRRSMPRGSLVLTAPSSVREVSLVMIFQALHVCRRSRSAAYVSSQHQTHGQQQHASRRVAGGAAVSATTTNSGSSERSEETGKASKKEAKGGAGRAVRGEKRAPATRGKAAASSNQRALQSPQKAHAAAANRPSKAAPPSSGVAMKRSVADGTKREKKDAKSMTTEQAALLRRLSKMSATSSDASSLHPSVDAREPEPSHVSSVDGEDREDLARADSFRSAHSASSASSATPTVKIPSMGVNNASSSHVHAPSGGAATPSSEREKSESDRHDQQAKTTMTQVRDVEPTLTVWMFNTDKRVDGDTMRRKSLDGAVCLTAKLCLSPTVRCVVLAQGVYFHANGDRLEVWSSELQEIDMRMPLEGAVAELRQVVMDKKREGFILVPEQEQLDAMDQLQLAIREASCPGYAKDVHSPTKHTKRPTRSSLEEPLPDQAYPLRRGGMLVKPSLDRGSTWVRQKSSSDLLAMLSDSMLQSHLKMKKRQSLLLASGDNTSWKIPEVATPKYNVCARSGECSGDRVAVSPSVGSHDPLDTGDYGQLMRAWGLQHEDEWVVALNDRLRGSRSLPSLGHTEDATKATRRSRPRELQPIIAANIHTKRC